jgi:hypothetical protein
VLHGGARLTKIRGISGASVSTLECKVATNALTVGGVFQTPVLTEFDKTFVQGVRLRTVAAHPLGAFPARFSAWAAEPLQVPPFHSSETADRLDAGRPGGLLCASFLSAGGWSGVCPCG